jgi:CubicO group peptidase (beta-lactamase class C family)
MTSSVLAAGLLALLFPGAGGPERTPSDAIDEVVASVMAADELPSVALVVGRDRLVLKRAAYGQASLELAVPATTQTVYPIASATKTFTSLAVQMLVREGKFSLEDSITELLPDLPDGWLEVTPCHLLSHTSGLPDVAVQAGREALVADTRADALRGVCARPLDFPVGAGWRYNQTNYMLLLMLVEKYGQRPFEDFVRARILAPLGLEATRFGDVDDVLPGRASMYERRDGALRPRQSRFPEFMRGAAGLNTNVEEWYRWADAWAHGQIIPREELEAGWQPAVLASGATASLAPGVSYGLGVMVVTRPGWRSVGHSGGGNAAFRYFLDDDLLVVMATNGKTDEDALLDKIAAAARKMAGK